MASNAYSYQILANGADGKHDTSPSWVVTFVRWRNRYLFPEQSTGVPSDFDFLQTLPPLVIRNDCASVSVSYSKSSHTPSVQAMFYPGDINYLSAVSPGDFMFVNMLNFPEDAKVVADAAGSSRPINRVEHGFKGYFKVQSVRRVLAIDPATGSKRVMFRISGFALTEFNNTLYFNPFLLTQNEVSLQFLFVSRITQFVEQLVANKGVPNIQDIIKILINATIGEGLNSELLENKAGRISPNVHFYVPQNLGQLMGIGNAKSAADLNSYLFGVQTYAGSQASANLPLGRGMNPRIERTDGRFLFTPTNVEGESLVKPEYWNQTTVWSILNQYLNAPVNEMYATFRVSPNDSIFPTIVLRQTPFSSNQYQGLSTKFMNLPRWVISPDLLLNIDIGKEEAARFNFVQANSQLSVASDSAQQYFISQQIANKNFRIDLLDVRRSGLKPYIFSSNFDNINSDKKAINSPRWAGLIADSLIGGELRLNGSIQTYGIVEPICVGDNLELDGVVYHIESVTHSATLQPDGKRSFTTTLELSHGIDVRSESGPKIFPQMETPAIDQEISRDRDNFNSILPGISDNQPSRASNSDSFRAPFPNSPVRAARPQQQKATVDSPIKREGKTVRKGSK